MVTSIKVDFYRNLIKSKFTPMTNFPSWRGCPVVEQRGVILLSQKSDELIREIHSERQKSAAAKSDSQKSDEAIFEPNANRKFGCEILAIQGEKGNKKSRRRKPSANNLCKLFSFFI